MKKILLLSILVILRLYPQAQSLSEVRDSLEVSEAEFLGVALWVDGSETKKLEKQIPIVKSKVNISGYIIGEGNGKSYISINGEHSPIRIPENQRILLLIKVANNNIDPSGIINIVPLETIREERWVNSTKVSSFGGISREISGLIRFDAVKYGDHSYLISIEDQLPIGEYGIFINDELIKNISAFGVGNPAFDGGENNITNENEDLKSEQSESERATPDGGSIYIPQKRYIGVWKSTTNNMTIAVFPDGKNCKVVHRNADGKEMNWIAKLKKGYIIDVELKQPYLKYNSISKTLFFKGDAYKLSGE